MTGGTTGVDDDDDDNVVLLIVVVVVVLVGKGRLFEGLMLVCGVNESVPAGTLKPSHTTM